MVRAMKRKDLMTANEHLVPDSAGRIKRRNSDERLSTAEYLRQNSGQLFAFGLSFVLIATFWVSHERLYSVIEIWRAPLMILNFAWMLTIVFLPVITAMVGSMPTDNLQLVIYVGTMLLTNVLMAAMSGYALGHPEIWQQGARPTVSGLAAALAQVVLFGLSILFGALVIPNGWKYLILLILFFSGPVQKLIERILGRLRPGLGDPGPESPEAVG
jgi:uncharacterized membrane protein